jgi:capsular polysaccharide biosynthesis protein
MENKNKEYYTIDLMHIIKTLLHRVWIIILTGLIGAGVGFSISNFVIKPTYSSSILLYVNNTSFSLGDTSVTISSSQITAAQNLVKTYGVILNNRTTLERVIDKTDVKYTYRQLSSMIDAEPANKTEIMKVTVTANDPYEAAKIANGIAEVLPVRVSEIVDGASMEVVDSAIPELNKIGPNITSYTASGLVWGVLLAVIVLVIIALLDDRIHDEDYVLQNYDCPILAKIPDLISHDGSKHYDYYYQSNKKSDNKKGGQ